MAKERLLWVDRMRGIAILCVVMQHLENYINGYYVSHVYINMMNMGLFFFVSGFIIDYTTRIENWRDVRFFLWKKTVQLLVPLYVWTFVVRLFVFRPDWLLPDKHVVIDELIHPQLWFLHVLFIYMVFFALYKLIETKIKRAGGEFG